MSSRASTSRRRLMKVSLSSCFDWDSFKDSEEPAITWREFDFDDALSVERLAPRPLAGLAIKLLQFPPRNHNPYRGRLMLQISSD